MAGWKSTCVSLAHATSVPENAVLRSEGGGAGEKGDAFHADLTTLATEGTSRKFEEAQRAIDWFTGEANPPQSTGGGEESPRLQRGKIFATDEYVITELFVAPLPLNASKWGEPRTSH